MNSHNIANTRNFICRTDAEFNPQILSEYTLTLLNTAAQLFTHSEQQRLSYSWPRTCDITCTSRFMPMGAWPGVASPSTTCICKTVPYYIPQRIISTLHTSHTHQYPERLPYRRQKTCHFWTKFDYNPRDNF